jgi:6-phosphogluconolactonase
MGPDGHTCSLFPGHPLLLEQHALVSPIEDSPKPPPRRITLTLPALAAARSVLFVAAGAAKAELLRRVLANDSSLPAALVKPAAGGESVRWFVDAAAVQF